MSKSCHNTLSSGNGMVRGTVNCEIRIHVNDPFPRVGGGGGEGEGTRPGTEKLYSHNLQSDPLGSGFKKARENFPH